MILKGKIIQPNIEKAKQARIKIEADPQMDDYWKLEPTIKSAKAIGWMEKQKGKDTLDIFCSIPKQSAAFIATALTNDKIRYITIIGTKLKRNKGIIQSVSLSKEREELE